MLGYWPYMSISGQPYKGNLCGIALDNIRELSAWYAIVHSSQSTPPKENVMEFVIRRKPFISFTDEVNKNTIYNIFLTS